MLSTFTEVENGRILFWNIFSWVFSWFSSILSHISASTYAQKVDPLKQS